MALKEYKPTSPGRRSATAVDYSILTRKEPEKRLLSALRKTGGRNNQGEVTCRHIGGGNRRQYRIIDFKRDKDNIPARVLSIEYDPNRTAFIALLCYSDGEKRYIIAPKDIQAGEVLMSGEKVEPKNGNTMPIKNIPLGLFIHNVELYKGRGGQMVRSAGSFAKLMAREGEYAHLQLPSGEIRKVHVECRATIGQVSNPEYSTVWLGKAGRKRWLGIKPTVRGTAQNPVSHPMGGGEGRSGGGRHPCSPWGKLAKGGKTRKRRSPSSAFIIRRRRP
ncbi:MAG: 50S ribosomal protein L2 [Planctomycetota bacterium]